MPRPSPIDVLLEFFSLEELKRIARTTGVADDVTVGGSTRDYADSLWLMTGRRKAFSAFLAAAEHVNPKGAEELRAAMSPPEGTPPKKSFSTRSGTRRPSERSPPTGTQARPTPPSKASDVEALAWLADTWRNRGIAAPSTRTAEIRERLLDPDYLKVLVGPDSAVPGTDNWVKALALVDVPLSYEPRSIQVAPDGKSVAVGTKGGDVWVVRWDPLRVAWGTPIRAIGPVDDPIPLQAALSRPSKERRRAIRALGFLGTRFVVAGGGHPDRFRVFDLDRQVAIPVSRHGPEPEDSSADSAIRARQDRWRGAPTNSHRRFRGWVLLAAPTRDLELPLGEVWHDVALGTTPGDLVYVLSARLEKGQFAFRTRMGTSREFLPRTPSPDRTLPALEGAVPHGRVARIVGGGWWRRALWALDDRGQLYRGHPDRPDGWDATSEGDHRVRLAPVGDPVPSPRGRVRFSGMTRSWDALGLRAGEWVTVLASSHLGKEMDKDDAQVHVPVLSNVRWEHVPGLHEFALFRAFLQWSSEPDKDEPLWIVASTDEPGLEWRPWKMEGKHLTPLRRQVPKALAGVGSTEVLVLRHGAWFPQVPLERPEGRTPCYLAVGTRDHHLRIASLVHMRNVERLLLGELPRVDWKAREAAQVLRGSAGLRRWRTDEFICRHFEVGDVVRFPEGLATGSRQAWPADRLRPVDLLDSSDADDVKHAARTLTKVLRHLDAALLKMSDGARAARCMDAFSEWTLALLERAAQLDDDPARPTRRHVALQLIGAVARLESSDLRDLNLLAEVVQKWVIEGPTFATKATGLLNLARWNWEGRRQADALAYATRLLDARVDPLWQSRLAQPEPNVAVWAMAAAADQSFTVQSHHDGRLTGCLGRDGTTLRWRVTPKASKALRGRLDATDPYAILRAHSDDFINTYRHGAYARSILLRSIGSSHVLAFSTRGRRDPKKDADRPWLFVLLVRLEADVILVEEAVTTVAPRELYAIVESPLPTRGGTIRLLTGTDAVVGEPALPFVEWQFDPSEPSLSQVHPIPVTDTYDPLGYQPAHCIAVSAEAPVVWVGREDGHVLGYRHDTTRWALEPELSFHLAGRISALATPPKGEPRMLAVGTADGSFSLYAIPESGRPLRIIHTQESGAVRGVSFFMDELRFRGSANGDPTGLHVAFLTIKGVLGAFDVNVKQPRTIRADRVPRPDLISLRSTETTEPGRRCLAGDRLDRIHLQGNTVALHIRGTTKQPQFDEGTRPHATLLGDGMAPPTVLVGDGEGQLQRFVLAVPRGSSRREILFEASRRNFDLGAADSGADWAQERCLSNARGFAAALGIGPPDTGGLPMEDAWRFLRVFDFGLGSFVRFSLRSELEACASAINWQDPKGTVERFAPLLRRLADESYRMRPFSREPAKVIWEQGGRVARQLLTRSLSSNGTAHADAGLRVLEEIDRALQRWIGFDESVESLVLMQAFEATFDWPLVVRLVCASKGDRLTLFVNRRMVLDRLAHSDLTVPLETLRVINRAMERAVDVLTTSQATRLFAFPQVASGAEVRVLRADSPFEDLLEMVGRLALRRRDQLGPSAPLYTEMARTFALAILIFPDSSLAIGRILSEHRLKDVHKDVSPLVVELAQDFVRRFNAELAVAVQLGDSVKLFESYLKDELDRDIPSQGRPPGEPSVENSNDDIRRELRIVRSCVRELADLRGGNTPSVDMLGEEPRYFRHSAAVFRRWRQWREQIVKQLDDLNANDVFEKGGAELLETALQNARKVVDPQGMTPLFEPQRTSYLLDIVGEWKKTVEFESQASRRIERLKSRYKRHVLQGAAADLLALKYERILQMDPQFYEGDVGPLRQLLRDRIARRSDLADLLEDYDRTWQLVSSSQLDSALSDAAERQIMQRRTQAGEAPDVLRTGAPALTNVIEEMCKDYRIALKIDTEHRPAEVPGAREIWEAMFFELFTNERRHSGADIRVRWDHQDTIRFLRIQSSGPPAWLPATGAKTLVADAWREARHRSEGGWGLDMVRALASLSGMRAGETALWETPKVTEVWADLTAGSASPGWLQKLDAHLRAGGDRNSVTYNWIFAWRDGDRPPR